MVNTFRVVRVTATDPNTNSATIYDYETGTSFPGVRVMAPSIGTNVGVIDLPIPMPTDGDIPSLTRERDVFAVVGYLGREPFILGFLAPETCQMMFEAGRKIVRHGSDVYTSIDDAGSMELYHPSGTFFRFGVTEAHEDLTGKDYRKKWAIKRNTDKAIHANLEVWNGGVKRAQIHIDPNGNLTQYLKGNVTQTIEGSVTETVTGNVDVTTPKATVHGDAEVTGNVKMAGGSGMCVTTESVCAFLGTTHPEGSTKVTAGS